MRHFLTIACLHVLFHLWMASNNWGNTQQVENQIFFAFCCLISSVNVQHVIVCGKIMFVQAFEKYHCGVSFLFGI